MVVGQDKKRVVMVVGQDKKTGCDGGGAGQKIGCDGGGAGQKNGREGFPTTFLFAKLLRYFLEYYSTRGISTTTMISPGPFEC